MLQIQLPAPGDAAEMKLVETGTPAPGHGELLVRVEAAGVNFIDIYHRTGLYPSPAGPITLGVEGAGVVEASGSGTRDAPAPGQRVAWVGPRGSYATHAIIPADRAVPVPEGLDGRQAAAAMLQGMTAHYLVTDCYALGTGDACLVHAAAGGVGLLLCQLGRSAGARVIGTCSTEEKSAAATAAGADAVIRYTEQDFEAEVHALTRGQGVQVVYDSVGKTTFAKSLRCLAPRGMLVLFGQSSGPVESFDPQLLNRHGSLFLTRPSLFHYVASREELMLRATAVLSAVRDGSLSLTVHAELPLARAADAHTLLESRATRGKLLLLPG